MTCEEFVGHLSAYIDSELDGELRADALEHLATCDRCPVVLNTTERTIELLRRVGRGGLPEERRQAVLERIRSALP